PDGAIVARIDRRLRVVLPAHRVLRRFTFDHHGLVKGHHTGRVAREPAGQALARKIRRPAERIADRDVAETIDRRTGHPTIQTIRRVRALLTQADAAILLDRELVPAHAAA